MTVEELLKASVALFEEARKTEDNLQSMACSSAAQAGAMIAQAMMLAQMTSTGVNATNDATVRWLRVDAGN